MVDRTSEMEAFATVVRTGSLSAAARSLRLTPSALSRTISRIEARLGVRLLVRTTRALTLTPEGLAYHAAAQRILADLAEAEADIATMAAPRGRLRVNAVLAYGRIRIVPLLSRFVDIYPEILVDLTLSNEAADVLGGQADIAIRFGPLPDLPLNARRLDASGRTVVASPAYLARAGVPLVPEDLRHHNCLNLNRRRFEAGWPFLREGAPFEVPVKGNIQANSGETLKQLVLQGAGIARLADFHIEQDLAAGQLVALLEPYNPGDIEEIHALFIGGGSVPGRVRAFIDFMVEHLTDNSRTEL